MLNLQELKNIKKRYKILIASLFALVLFLIGLYGVFKSARVQTFITKKIASYLSAKLHTKVSIESVDIEFLDKLVLRQLYIQDHGQDTLLFAPGFKLTVVGLNFKENLFQIDDVVLEDAYLNIRKFKRDGDFNFQFLLDAFSGSTKSEKKQRGPEILCNKISLKNCRLNYSLLYKFHGTWGIDWDYIKLKKLNVNLYSLHTYGDTINTYMRDLSFVEQSGFYISNASCFFKAHSQKMHFKNFEASTRQSKINANIRFKYNSWSDFEEFIDRVNIDVSFKRSKLEMADISFFAKELKGLSKEIYITGDAVGTIRNFTANPILIEFGNKTSVEGKLRMEGLPDAENTLINFKIKNLYTCKEDIEGIPLPPFDKKDFIDLPEEVLKMGEINYKGDFTGFYNNFVTYGTIRSNLGEAQTDIKIDYNTQTDITSYSGKITTRNFDLGKLLSNTNLGIINANVTVEGKGFSKETLDAKAKGILSAIELYGYNYKNIMIDGTFKNKQFKGDCSINDPNINLSFNGDINLKAELPHFTFDASIENIDLNALKILDNKGEPFKISAKVEVDAKGKNIDEFTGNVSIEELVVTNPKQTYELGEILINSQETAENQKKLIVVSDVLDARLNGIYAFSQMAQDFKVLVNYHFSNLFKNAKSNINSSEQFTFNLHLKNTVPISELFFPDIVINKTAFINGYFNSFTKQIEVKTDIPSILLYGVSLNNLKSEINGNRQDFIIKNSIQRAEVSDSVWFENVKLNAHPWAKRLSVGINWNNEEKFKNSGHLESLISFNDSANTLVEIRESNIFIRDTNWVLTKPGKISIDTNQIYFDEIEFGTKSQHIAINGIISNDPQKILKIDLLNFITANFNPLLKNYDVEINGIANGFITINDIYRKPVFNAQLNLSDFTLNGEDFGRGEIMANYDDSRKNVKVSGNFLRGNIPTIMFSGMYFPFKKENDIDFSINLNKTQLKILQRFTDGVLSDLKGYATGDILITGSSSQPELYGLVDIQKGGLKVDYLNTVYSFNGQLSIKPTYFELANGEMYDELGHQSVAHFRMTHQNFKKFAFDIRIEANNMLCLNTTQKQNNLFYGKAFASGLIKISGPVENVTIDVAAKTEKGTQIFIPYNGSTEVTENSFVKFINRDTTASKKEKIQKTDLTGVQTNFDLEITPDAQFQMVFDSKVGDVIKGRGQGNIKMDINTNGTFNMYGDYRFTDGDYLFTFENALNKKFKIEPGSLVSWSGDPFNATIDINTVYKTKTSLAILLQDSSAEFKRNIPVNVMLKLTDKLFKPSISFGINFPTQANNETLKARVNTIIGNENNNELNRQVFALLMIGSFIPPSGAAQGATRVSEGIGNSSAELLSAQFNNWISQLSKEINLGVNYKPASSTGFTSNQIELAVSTQLFDNRLSIDGNFGVANRQQTAAASSLVDVNVEYKLTNNGKLRVKAYNKPNDFINYFTQGYNKQGVGLIYKEEFNSLEELLKRKRAKPVSTSTPAILPDKNETEIKEEE